MELVDQDVRDVEPGVAAITALSFQPNPRGDSVEH